MATQAALMEFGTREAESILKDFYKDSRDVTDAKVWALKQSGYDTTVLESEIAKRRQELEEKRQEKVINDGTKQNNTKAARMFDNVIGTLQKGIEWVLGVWKKEWTQEEIKDLTLKLKSGQRWAIEESNTRVNR